MQSYTVFDAATGEILRTGKCQDGLIDAQAGEGEAAIEGDFDADLVWFPQGEPQPIPPRPEGHVVFHYAKGQWIDPRSLDEVRAEAKSKVVAWASATLSRFTAGYPHEEVLSWSAKLPAARRVLDGASEPMIEIEAKALGVTPMALAERVISKGAQYEAIVALAAAIRSRTNAAIDAADTVEAVDVAIARALAEATATLKALGAT